MTLQASVSLSWVNTVLDAAQRQGCPRPQLLAHAGIAERQLDLERWPIDDITRLWRAAAALTEDPGFGLKAGSQVGPASFNVVSFILQSASTLRSALAVVQKFQRLISDGGRFQIIAGETASWVVYHPCQGELAFSPHQIEAVLAATVSFSRWLAGSDLRPWRAQLGHAAVGPLIGYREIFRCPVDFEQAFSGLLFDNAALDRMLPQANAQLATLHQEYAATRLAVLADTPSLARELSTWIAARLAQGVPDKQSAARALSMTPRTLARRLHSMQLNYSALVDTVRKDLACQSVAHSRRSFAAIAQSLGFAEASTFNRAFRRWTGSTPGEWRARLSTDAEKSQDF